MPTPLPQCLISSYCYGDRHVVIPTNAIEKDIHSNASIQIIIICSNIITIEATYSAVLGTASSDVMPKCDLSLKRAH